MLRFEGEVFLFGTAMEAPVLESDYKKIGDDRCLFNGEAPRRRPDRRERGSYNGKRRERKAVGLLEPSANCMAALAPEDEPLSSSLNYPLLFLEREFTRRPLWPTEAEHSP